MGFSWDGLLVVGGRAFHEEQSLAGKGRPRRIFRALPRAALFLRRAAEAAAGSVATPVVPRHLPPRSL